MPVTEKGISLLEVIVAVVILGIAGSCLVVASRTSATGQQRARTWGDAATATKEALESIQLLPLDSVSRLSDAVMGHSQGGSVEVRASARGVMPSDVGDFAALDTSTLRHVTLRTRFPGRSGSPVTRSFSTIVYKP